MKIYSLLCIFLSIVVNSQIKFEKGYIITEGGERKDALIKNMDWSNNPESFIYKLTETGQQQTGQLVNVKEFGVPNQFKYIKYSGKIDISSNNINDLSINPNPVFEEKTVFLNELVDGKIKLYQYKNKDIEQYFYSKEDGAITPLIYKKYNPSGDIYKIAENDKYINQLKELFIESTPNKFKPLKAVYEKTYLIEIFEEYNGKKTEIKNNHLDFNLSIRPGLSIAKLNLDTNNDYYHVDFLNKNVFRIGLEAELVLPFNNNKWSMVAEPFYHRYKNESLSRDGNYRFQTNFDMLDLDLALRHYMFISKNSKIFINAGFGVNLYMTKDALISYISLRPGYLNGGSYITTNSSYFNFGLGYNYNNKFSSEIKISTKKELNGSALWNTDLSRISFILGYNIF